MSHATSTSLTKFGENNEWKMLETLKWLLNTYSLRVFIRIEFPGSIDFRSRRNPSDFEHRLQGKGSHQAYFTPCTLIPTDLERSLFGVVIHLGAEGFGSRPRFLGYNVRPAGMKQFRVIGKGNGFRGLPRPNFIDGALPSLNALAPFDTETSNLGTWSFLKRRRFL